MGEKSANGADLREYKGMLELISARIGATAAPDKGLEAEEIDTGAAVDGSGRDGGGSECE